MATEETLADVVVERTGSLGRIRLNRPKAMNSLTRDMVHLIAPALDAFEKDATIAAVLLTGEGERGLCAGGDIRALYEGERTPDGMGAQFWRDEYRVNARIARFAKPYLAVMDGITMGGGIGLSAHGAHRIVTERSRIAMPEVGIGFVPDVGGTWLLAHAPGEIGTPARHRDRRRPGHDVLLHPIRAHGCSGRRQTRNEDRRSPRSPAGGWIDTHPRHRNEHQCRSLGGATCCKPGTRAGKVQDRA